jgi:hypothetical protein
MIDTAERRVPAAVMTERFVSRRIPVSVVGMPEYKFTVIGHPSAALQMSSSGICARDHRAGASSV